MAVSTIKQDVLLTATSPSGSRKLARKSNGDLWAVYVRSDGTRLQIYAAYSQDNGLTWTEEQVSEATGSYDQGNPVIAIDSEDNIHVVWSGQGVGAEPTYQNIQYRKRTTSWQTKANITDGSLTRHQQEPAITIDSNDYIHLVWYSNGGYSTEGWPHIVYCKYTTSWQAVENVTSGTTTNYSPSIAIDSSDNVHVVWRRGAYSAAGQGIYYRKRTTSWQTEELVQGSTRAVLSPCLAIDSSDNPHCVYHYYDGIDTDAIRYRKRTTSWQTEETIHEVSGEVHVNPSISLDRDDKLHVVWTDATNDYILHSEKVTSWTAAETLVSSQPSHWSNLIWANYPVGSKKTNIPAEGYAFVFTWSINGRWDAMYYPSPDLRWRKRLGSIHIDQLKYQHAERMARFVE